MSFFFVLKIFVQSTFICTINLLKSCKIQMVFVAIAKANSSLHCIAVSLLFHAFDVFVLSKTASVTIFIICGLFSMDGSFIKIIKILYKNFIFIVLLFLVLICLTALSPHSGH